MDDQSSHFNIYVKLYRVTAIWQEIPVVLTLPSIAIHLHRNLDSFPNIRYRFDRMYYVVDSRQRDHFTALFAALRGLGHPWADKCTHHR